MLFVQYKISQYKDITFLSFCLAFIKIKIKKNCNFCTRHTNIHRSMFDFFCSHKINKVWLYSLVPLQNNKQLILINFGEKIKFIKTRKSYK